jgi:hypothetical protein
LQFDDFDLDVADLGGNINWAVPQETLVVTYYAIYFASSQGTCTLGQDITAQLGSNVSMYGITSGVTTSTTTTNSSTQQFCEQVLYARVPFTVSFQNVPVDTSLSNYTHILVYSESTVGEMNTPVVHLIMDANESVSAMAFLDLDLDPGELGGELNWTQPDFSSKYSVSRTEKYHVYLSASTAGTARSQLGEVLFGNDDFAVPVETPLAGSQYLNVYTRSSLTEQTTPVALSVQDSDVTAANFSFADFDLDLGELGGDVTWDNIHDSYAIGLVTKYQLYVATLGGWTPIPGSTSTYCGTGWNVLARTSLDTFTGPFSASESNVFTLGLNFNPGSSGFGPNRHILVYTTSSLVEQTTPACHLIFDVDATVGSLAFDDLDLDAFELGGGITWQAPAAAMYERVLAYEIYLAASASGSSRSQIGVNVARTAVDLTLAADIPDWQAPNPGNRYVAVYTRSTLLEQTTPASDPFSDTVSSVINVTFPDLDLDETHLGGDIGWLAPADYSHVTFYMVYFALSSDGSSRIYYSNVSQNEISISLAPDTSFDQAQFTHFVVYSTSSFVEQTTPAGHLISDTFASVSDITFIGLDLNLDDLGGTVTWVQPLLMTGLQSYRVYLATDAANFSQRSQIGSVSSAYTDSLIPGPGSVVRSNFTRFLVYTESQLCEQTTPTEISFEDAAKYFTSKDLYFVDEDLDLAEIGGNLTWKAPRLVATVTTYNVYLAEGSLGQNRSFLGNSSEGTEHFEIPSDTLLKSYTHAVVNSESSIVEQRTPAALQLADAYVNVGTIGFFDKDLDPDEIGGLVTWPEPPASALASSSVIGYTLYLAADATGQSGRSLLGTGLMPVGTSSYIIPADTRFLTYTHLVVFTHSALVEQTTPTFLKLSDTIASVGNISFPDHDLDLTDLGGDVEWNPPLNVTHVVSYEVYLAYYPSAVVSCSNPLVGSSSSPVIPDASITASSYWQGSPQFGANGQMWRSRLDNSQSSTWCAWPTAHGGIDSDPFVQWDFGQPKQINKVQTLGRADAPGYQMWVTQFRLSYSTYGTVWYDHPTLFIGNTDPTTLAQSWVSPPIVTRYL